MSFKDVRESIGSTLYRQVGRANSHVQEYRSVPVDVLESDDGYLVVFDAPGVTTEDIQVRYLDGNVKVQIDRFRPFYEGFEMTFPGRGMALGGDVDLPADALVDPDAATARLTDVGTLNIEIPKGEPVDDEERVEPVDEESESEDAEVTVDD
ncbi:Hsp20/alpha crystallin family protein [Natronobiforma cellulositropha]|uniref:Hsp20/alpha crystallin family protein n=1 Tax=Natronobiforma cellulositropha TaxID=1679076 RepID=UPI0021D5EFAE|nr:Hsp20 family protein [Natronobiforma cellulositropha]